MVSTSIDKVDSIELTLDRRASEILVPGLEYSFEVVDSTIESDIRVISEKVDKLVGVYQAMQIVDYWPKVSMVSRDQAIDVNVQAHEIGKD